MEHIYDMIVLGGGAAGYTAALYAVRGGLDTLVLEKLAPGGQMALTTHIDNYPGFDRTVDGYTLSQRMAAGAQRFGAKTELLQALSAHLSGQIKRIETAQGVHLARTVVIATGARPKPLGLPREDAYIGRGLSYCATCDGLFYRDKTVAVVGGGNSAVAEALELSRVCRRVILIHRSHRLRAGRLSQERLQNTPNITIRYNSRLRALEGDDRVTAVTLEDVNTGTTATLPVDGVFISIGRTPETELFQGQLALDKGGYIVADETTQTGLPGVYAAGDVRTKALRQIVTATADGAMAAHFAGVYLDNKASLETGSSV